MTSTCCAVAEVMGEGSAQSEERGRDIRQINKLRRIEKDYSFT